MIVYLIGSLRNPAIPVIAGEIRAAGFEVFDDWYAAGPEADDYWQTYEKSRGRVYAEALAGYAANHVYNFDRTHLMRADAGVLVLPAGRSGHLELGYMVGQGKPGYILLEGEPERWDVMYRFADGVYNTIEALVGGLNGHLSSIQLRQPSAYERSQAEPRSLESPGDINMAGRGWRTVIRTTPESWAGVCR